VEKAIRDAVAALRPARIGSSHQVKLQNWSRQRSEPALKANFPNLTDSQIVEQFKELSGVEGLTRAALDARVQTIAAFALNDGALVGSFSTWSAHCALLSREHETQSADYFGEAAGKAEAEHRGAVVAVAAGSIGDCDPLPPGMELEELLEKRKDLDSNEALVVNQAAGLAKGLLEAIADAKTNQSELRSLSPRFLEERISEANVESVALPKKPQIGIPTLAGSELGTGDISVSFFKVHMREGVRQRGPDTQDAHYARSRTNKDDRLANLWERTVGRVAAWVSFLSTTSFLDEQVKTLPVRYLSLELGDRTLGVLGLPGEPTTWLAAQLAKLTNVTTLVTGVTGEYAGYLTTEAEYAVQHYEGGSTIWGRYTERWLRAQVKRLVAGEGTERSLDPPEFKVLREKWKTRIDGDSGTFTKK
jgi:neutral ceramidase